MDTFAHLLVGYLIAIAFVYLFNLHAIRRRVVITALIASQIPDLDLYLNLMGRGYYLVHHRGLSSIPMIFVIAYLSYKLATIKWPKKHEKERKRMFDVALICGVAHAFLDLSGSWGHMFWWPFSIKRTYLDTNPIVDVYVLVPLVLFFIAIRIFPKKTSFVTKLTIFILLTHFGFKGYLHHAAIAHAHNNGLTNAAAIPTFLNPFEWYIISDNGDEYKTTTLDLQNRIWENNMTIPKGNLDSVYEAARTNKELAQYLHWARFPIEEDGTLNDIRFGLQRMNHFAYTIPQSD